MSVLFSMKQNPHISYIIQEKVPVSDIIYFCPLPISLIYETKTKSRIRNV